MAMDIPVLMIVYRRPHTTKRVLAALAEVRPRRLFVSANAPDPSRADDAARCQEVRALFDNLPWPCEVIRCFRTEHLRAKHSIASGIDWFFEQVEEGIILEDDCEPHPTFFPFCAELLARYRDDARVMHINANSFQDAAPAGAPSYFFSAYSHVWGWATWRRAWRRNDLEMSGVTRAEISRFLAPVHERLVERCYWTNILCGCLRDHFETWDFQWGFAIMRHAGLSITPRVNLVRNLGFGADSTNTQSAGSSVANLEMQPLPFPLVHPSSMEIDRQADRRTSERLFKITWPGVFRAWLSSLIPLSMKKPLKRLKGRLGM
jgi:hypothetical protein